MKKRLVQLMALLLVAVFLAACGKEAAPRPQLNNDFPGTTNSFTFNPQPSQSLTLSAEGAQSVLEVIRQQIPQYAHQELYALEEVKSRLDFDASVQTHQYSALDEAGKLTGSHLHQLVLENNEAFLAEEPFGYTPVEDDYIADLCDFIVNVVELMADKYPQVDWNRVYCNLGQLKILYDTGMLSFAQVSPELVLAISKNNTTIVLNMKGEDGFTRVLTHEIMHIIQIGCSCENIENCERRAGIAVYWKDFTLNTTDWTWMVEGSAERHMCALTGGEAISYQYKMDYLCSMTMSVLLRDSVEADTMETLCFYSDPDLLFETFGCEDQEQIDELLNMMITLQVLQMQPTAFHSLYTEKTGVDLTADEEAMNEFSYALKPAICITLSKEFYENLLPSLQSGELTCNDLFFLINLFEGHLNQHLSYTSESKAQYNQVFFDSYRAMRKGLFEALEQDDPDLDLEAMYEAYEITPEAKQQLNAQLSMLPQEKLDFLAERAQWQSELNGLGQKVPQAEQ